MNTSVRITLIFLLACLSACQQQEAPRQAPPTPTPDLQAIAMDADDISGVVTSDNGPEAGVWVVAETTDLPTRLIKSVVTDDQGRRCSTIRITNMIKAVPAEG